MSITVWEIWERWSEHAVRYYRKPNGRPTGEARNVEHAMVFALSYANLPATQFGPAQLRACQLSMIDEGLARSTINARTNRIRRVFSWAVSMELLAPHRLSALRAVPPLRHGRSDARETNGMKPVPWEHVEATLHHLRQPTRGIVEVLWWSGMRVGEALRMRPNDLDRTGDVWLYTPQEHKTEHHGKERIIALGPQATAVVQQRLSALSTLLFPDADTRVFEFHNGRCHTPTSFRASVQRTCREIGVPFWTPLQLRHSAATRLRAEVGVEAARVILGHSSASTTEIYAEIDRANARSLMLRFG